MTGLRYYAPLAREAADALERRLSRYPALVEAGRIPADQADREIRVWRAIAAQWHWVATLERIDAPAATIVERVEALEESLRRADRVIMKLLDTAPADLRRACLDGAPVSVAMHGGAAEPVIAALEQIERLDAMLDWARREDWRDPRYPIAWYVETNILLREAAARDAAMRAVAA